MQISSRLFPWVAFTIFCQIKKWGNVSNGKYFSPGLKGFPAFSHPLSRVSFVVSCMIICMYIWWYNKDSRQKATQEPEYESKWASRSKLYEHACDDECLANHSQFPSKHPSNRGHHSVGFRYIKGKDIEAQNESLFRLTQACPRYRGPLFSTGNYIVLLSISREEEKYKKIT